jgi:hypothetical protein
MRIVTLTTVGRYMMRWEPRTALSRKASYVNLGVRAADASPGNAEDLRLGRKDSRTKISGGD